MIKECLLPETANALNKNIAGELKIGSYWLLFSIALLILDTSIETLSII